MSYPDGTKVLTVKHTPCKVVAWLFVAFCMFCGVMALRTGATGVSLAFGVLALPGIYLILSSGSMQMNSTYITYHLPLRSYEIKWSEVKYMEIDSRGGNMVMVGENKQLAMVGPYLWSDKNKARALSFIGEQMEKHGIEIRTTEKAMIRLSRNTQSH